MKKLFMRLNKKVRYTIIAIILILGLGADAWCSKTVKENRKNQNQSVETEVIESSASVPVPSLESYEELAGQYKNDTETKEKNAGTDSKKKAAESSEGSKNSTYKKKDSSAFSEEEEAQIDSSLVSGTRNKVVDESKDTMRDETKGTEKEYSSSDEPNGKVKFHKVEKEGGTEVNGDVAAGGKQDVGTWN